MCVCVYQGRGVVDNDDQNRHTHTETTTLDMCMGIMHVQGSDERNTKRHTHTQARCVCMYHPAKRQRQETETGDKRQETRDTGDRVWMDGWTLDT